MSFSRFIPEIPSCLYNLIHYFQAFNYLAESGVIAIQMRGGSYHNEKLGTSGIRNGRPGHGKNTSFVGEMVGKAITAELPFDTVARAPCSATLGTSALNHKAGNNPVKDQAIIKPLFYQGDKIVDRIGSYSRKKFRLYQPPVFHLDSYQWIFAHSIT